MIGFIGGTGPEGRGLGLRLALAGHEVIVGSRDVGRARDAVMEITALAPDAVVHSGLNDEAAEKAETVFVTVPYAAQRPVLGSLRPALSEKIVVTTVVPLRFGARGTSYLPIEAGSAAIEARETVPDSRVVAAFQTISAHDLLDPTHRLESDVVICSDDEEAKERVAALAEEIPCLRAVDGGSLHNAVFVEHITPLLLNINRIYKRRSAIRVTGLGEWERKAARGG